MVPDVVRADVLDPALALRAVVPQVADRLSYQEWEQQGKKSTIDLAQERMEEIIDTHTPDPITPAQQKDIDRILEDARAHYRKKGLM